VTEEQAIAIADAFIPSDMNKGVRPFRARCVDHAGRRCWELDYDYAKLIPAWAGATVDGHYTLCVDDVTGHVFEGWLPPP
jgi:hypothetical protein